MFRNPNPQRGPKPYVYTTYGPPVRTWTWYAAATAARHIARIRQGRGEDDPSSVVTERSTGRTWTIGPESDLVDLDEGRK